jgi:hypothetical protein
MSDSLLRWMKANGVAITRDNYIQLAWGSEPPDPWTPEHEAELPEELRTTVTDAEQFDLFFPSV